MNTDQQPELPAEVLAAVQTLRLVGTTGTEDIRTIRRAHDCADWLEANWPKPPQPSVKVLCHAEGERCHGCEHYRDPAKNPVCRYAPQPSADMTKPTDWPEWVAFGPADWPDSGENACYAHKCKQCGETFHGHKRRPPHCRKCAQPSADVEKLAQDVIVCMEKHAEKDGCRVADRIVDILARAFAEKDVFSDAQRIQIEYWQRRCGEEKNRAERAEAELADMKRWSAAKTEIADGLLCEVRELRAYRDRMEWLHRGNDKDAEGYEWGVFRVKWNASGQPESVLHTLTDLTDLDAAMGASRMPRYYDQIADLQSCLTKEQDHSQELKAERDQLRAELQSSVLQWNEQVSTLCAEVETQRNLAIDCANDVLMLRVKVERLREDYRLANDAAVIHASTIADLRAQLAAAQEHKERLASFVREFIDAWNNGMAGDSSILRKAVAVLNDARKEAHQ